MKTTIAKSASIIIAIGRIISFVLFNTAPIAPPGVDLNIYLVIFITLVAAFIASLSQLAYKRNLVTKISSIRHLIEALRNKYIIAGLLGQLTSLLIYLYALSGAALSVVYPLFASSFIFTTLLSALLLKEKFPMRRVAGVLLVFAGVVIIAMSAA